jgi:hypothetical protein
MSAPPSLQFGGTAVAVLGTFFADGAGLACRVAGASGAAPARTMDARLVSASHVVCILPELPVGEYAVSVSSNAQTPAPPAVPTAPRRR